MIEEKTAVNNTLKNVAQEMVAAARTAPKGRGKDTFVFLIAEADEIRKLSACMKETGEKFDNQTFLRDSQSILASPIMLLFGSRIDPMRLKKCGMCGFANCEEKDQHKNIPCVFNSGDLGIAIGSAVSVAMDRRVDNRIMYSVGQAAMELGLFDQDIKIAYGIPLSASSKNPFFDRK